MEKIYSRKRIRISRLNLMFIILISLIVGIIFSVYPVFVNACKARASSLAINISTEEVNKVMKDYQYEDFIEIHKSTDDTVTLVKAKIVPINEMISKITSNIKNEIDKKDEVQVAINLGAITKLTGLSNLGPKFYIKLEASGRSDSQT